MGSSGSPNNSTEWAVPFGKLSLTGEGAVRAVVRSGAGLRDPAAAAIEALTALKGSSLLEPKGCQQEAGNLSLAWQLSGARFTALPALAPGWRQAPAMHIPAAIELAQNVSRTSSELNNLRPRRFVLSPGQVFFCEDEAGLEHCCVAALPADGAAFVDFAATDNNSIAWTSADEILNGAPIDRAYLIGASLYYCLIGPLYPEFLPRTERIRRLILYSAGDPARARSVLTAALPKSLAGLGDRLADLISSLLSPLYERMITPARAALELDLFQAELTPPKLSAAWEDEGNIRVAAAILKSFAKRAPKSEVPWDVLARLLALSGDAAAAREAGGNVPRTPDQQQQSYIGHLRSIAARGPDSHAELDLAVKRLGPEPSTPPLSDHEFLYLVYVNGRWLGRIDQSLNLLNRAFTVSWDKIVRGILIARFAFDKNGWGDALRQCRECVRMIEKLPDKGSAPGRYAHAYVSLLDGIAHMRAVQSGMADAYLEDALVRFETAWVQLREFENNELDPAVVDWLQALTRDLAGKPGLDLVKLGASAFCHSIGIDPARPARNPNPPVPWFVETRVFAS